MSMNMVLFEEEQATEVAESLDCEVDDSKHIIDEEGRPIKCHTCDCEITTENVGYIVKGSKLFFCDNPVCAAHYINELSCR